MKNPAFHQNKTKRWANVHIVNPKVGIYKNVLLLAISACIISVMESILFLLYAIILSVFLLLVLSLRVQSFENNGSDFFENKIDEFFFLNKIK